MTTHPWETGNDQRRMTDLPTGPYLEAAKVWGGCMEKYAGDTTAHTWAWESFLAALRVYEFERAIIGLTRDDIEAPHTDGRGQASPTDR